METILAPSVESPPWARNSLWNRRTIAQTTAVIHGPNEIVESPVPVGWEQLPVTDGSFKEDRMKIKDEDKSTCHSKQGKCFPISFQYFFQLVYSEHEARQCDNPPDQAPLPR
jgi:hypothetical protein